MHRGILLNVERFIAKRISGTKTGKDNISKPIVKIGIIGISLGISVMLLTISIVLGFKKEIISKITGLTTDIVISGIDQNPGGESTPTKISEDTLKLIRQLPFTKHLQKTAFKNGLLKTEHENEGILLKGVTKDYDFSFIQKHLLEGKLPEFKEDEASKDILVSKSLCDKMDLNLKQKIQIHFLVQHEVTDSLSGDTFVKTEQRSRTFSICGIFKTDFSDFDDKISLIDLRQIQNLNYWTHDMAGKYELRIKDFEQLEQNQEQLLDLLGYNYNVLNVREVYSNIFIWLDKLDINGVIIVVLMILVATINMITALLILILERTNMVGLVKALGMNNADVRKIFLNISYRLIGKGMLWGNIVGIGLCLLQYYFKIAKLDSETYYVEFVAIDINWFYFLLLNIGTFVTCAIMLFLPSLIITRLTPIKTLKFD
ncbi:MAG: ABC transporter permease [Bacteroidia bacterium]|nr:ABC transporter permease [Bacteroidia bacterium]